MTQCLVRIASEIATKSRRTRRRFQERLTRNIRDALTSSGIDAEIESRWSRILVTADGDAVARRIADVFGVSSVSVIEARIPANQPGHRKGRIALWAFETWSEFDNVKVTRL